MNIKHCLQGYGDIETWGACTGHPNDPRTEVDIEYTPEEDLRAEFSYGRFQWRSHEEDYHYG